MIILLIHRHEKLFLLFKIILMTFALLRAFLRLPIAAAQNQNEGKRGQNDGTGHAILR